MGVIADKTAKEKNISREEQDAYAIRSYQRSAQSWSDGFFAKEVVPVAVPQKKGDPLMVKEDEEFKNVFFDKIPSLKPAFTADGSVTAANASTMNDGAAAVILMSKEKADALGIKPIAKIRSFADAAQEPEWFTTAPAKAVPIALEKAGLTMEEVDFFELNEAFAVVCLVNNRIMNIPEEKVNVQGGAISIGHPLGTSGARIVVTLINVLQSNGGKIGAAGICNGGGGAGAMVIELV
jgi:acetyl-CoA C-acetyltransferase